MLDNVPVPAMGPGNLGFARRLDLVVLDDLDRVAGLPLDRLLPLPDEVIQKRLGPLGHHSARIQIQIARRLENRPAAHVHRQRLGKETVKGRERRLWLSLAQEGQTQPIMRIGVSAVYLCLLYTSPSPRD